MVGLSDIPCIGKAVDRISNTTVEALFRGLRYMLCYNGLVNDLKSKIKKIEVQEGRVSRRADEERANGKTVENHVTEWQIEVQEIKARADRLCKRRPSWNCLNGVPIPNPVTRFRLGRKAAHEAQNVAELTDSGIELLANEIAYLQAEENIPISDTTYQKFGSREEAYGKLWDALVKEDYYPIIGIYGMPGVGKTRMMEKAWEDAIDKKVFNKVTRANVGAGNIDVINLQNQLAGYLDCHLESENNELRRASQLKSSLANGGKTLVVLDDAWGPIPLKRIGIPVGEDLSKGCKILLTSRREDVCLQNDCKDPIKIEKLMFTEAWDLFKDTVGTLKIESLQDTSLAEKVCEECGGLPLLLCAIGNALKFVTEDSWKHAHSQLVNCNFEEIEGIEPKVSAGIQLSFDNLKNETKTCLLLCSLFPEDAEIDIKMLADLATGSQLLNSGGNVRGLVDNLKASSLLLDGQTRDNVKMHDIIRDVARSVAARDQNYAFLFVTGDRHLPLLGNYSTRKLIQFVESDNFGRLTNMVCPNLHTLWLECNNQPQQISDSIFRGTDNLKLLIIKGMCIFPDQMPVQTFDKLTTLILEGCDKIEMWQNTTLRNLETLRISNCRLPNPLDVTKLKSLRKLEVLSGRAIEIVPNAISALSPTLAELHIPGGVNIFDAEGKILPISSELNKLTALTSLNIRLEHSKSCPAGNIVANLLDFRIHVGRVYSYVAAASETRSINFTERCMEGGGEVLVERAEEVILQHVKGSPNGLSHSNKDSYANLKKLSIEHCFDMEHLASIPQSKIQQSQPTTPFSKLTSLTIDYCTKLKYVFSASVAKCFLQLEELKIDGCYALEVVVQYKTTTDGKIIFPKLKSLQLYLLVKLRRFCGIMESNSTLPAGSDSLFDETVAFPALENLYISHYSSEIWGENCFQNKSFCRLKFLIFSSCSNMKFAIPLSMSDTFKNLEELVITMCKSVTQISLNTSRNLCPNLERLSIDGCHSLRNVFVPSTAKDLVHLKELVVKRCDKMSEIIGGGGNEEKYEEVVFPELTKLVLTELRNFKNIYFNDSVNDGTAQHQSSSAPKLSFPKLEKFEFYMSSKLEGMRLGRSDSTSEIRAMVVWSDGEIQLPSEWQLQLPNIEKLHLRNSWWRGSSYLMNPYKTLSFQRLMVLQVNNCAVSALFTCSVFGNLNQLQELIVKYCPLLEEVVREDNNIRDTHEIAISLLKLKSIELDDLPKLKGFNRSAKYAFSMPALTSVALDNCTNMESFTCTEIRTPLIQDFNTQFQNYQRHRSAAIIRPQGS